MTVAELSNKLRIAAQAEQTCPVVADSIVARVGCRNSDRDHFAVCPAELARSVHRSVIKMGVRFENFGREAVDSQDIRNRSSLPALFVVDSLQPVFSMVFINGSDPRHGAVPL